MKRINTSVLAAISMMVGLSVGCVFTYLVLSHHYDGGYRIKYHAELVKELEDLSPQSDLLSAASKLSELRGSLRQGDLLSQDLRDKFPNDDYLKGDAWLKNYELLIEDAQVGTYLNSLNELVKKASHEEGDIVQAQTLADAAKRLSQKIERSKRIIQRFRVNETELDKLLEQTKVPKKEPPHPPAFRSRR